MNGDELRSIGERPLDLDLANNLGNSVHDGVGREHIGSERHDLGHCPTVADHFEDLGGDERDRLGVIQLQTPRASSSGELAGRKNQELVDLARGQVHENVIARIISSNDVGF